MDVFAAVALVLLALIPGWIATVWLLWRIRSLRHSVRALETRLARLESPPPSAPPVDASVSTVARPTQEPALTTPAQPVQRSPVMPARRAAPENRETLESWIGGQWLLYIGVLAILVGVAYFEKLAFESAWLGETARVVQGAAAGLLLVYGGIRFARTGYSGYGHAIAGTGIAALYVSTYASFNFYHLIDRTTAFALMLVVTGAAAALADRQRSQGLAVLAVGGGYLTPFLLPGTTDTQIALFGYDAILAAGASLLARRRTWPLLYATSYLATLVTVAAWADRFYTPAKYLRTELFLTLFCALFVSMLARCRRRATGGERVAWLFLLSAPAAYYVASILILVPHATAFLVWSVAAAVIGAALAVQRSPRWGLLIDVAVLVPFLVWCSAASARSHLTDGLWTAAGMYALGLAGQIRIARTRPQPSPAFITWLHLNGLGAFAAAYLLLLFDHVALTSVAAAGFAIWHAGIAFGLRKDAPEPALHTGALALTLVAIAIALQFDGPAVTIGWGAEGFAIIALGLRTRRMWLRAAGVTLFGIAFVRAVSLLTEPPIVGQSAIVNRRAACAVFLIALAYGTAALLKRSGAGEALRTTAILAAQFLTLLWLTSEIRAYWSAMQAALTRELMLSVTWAAYATALVIVGLRRSFAPLRIFAMVVLAITIVKVFTVDLAQLQRVYRVVSVLGLGVMLLLTSYLYQKSRSGTPRGSSATSGDETGAA